MEELQGKVEKGQSENKKMEIEFQKAFKNAMMAKDSILREKQN